ncbi:hypothetical protein DPEC_G00343390 [Dallia pectoralis]|uniref:Uncharacterized protein n=1 Tax=Dallia pectoralis TaxID=75939 RepID=A0ACC2F2X0_DALPE|nr:hypothetical protein DPEC_G00343390 [Dallia pectoralis]
MIQEETDRRTELEKELEKMKEELETLDYMKELGHSRPRFRVCPGFIAQEPPAEAQDILLDIRCREMLFQDEAEKKAFNDGSLSQ